MKNGLVGFTMGALPLAMISMANAGPLVTLTNGQMGNFTAGAATAANAINIANTAAVAQTGNSSGNSINVAVAVDVTIQNAISVFGSGVAAGGTNDDGGGSFDFGGAGGGFLSGEHGSLSDAGLDQILMAAFQTGNGDAVTTRVSVPEPATLALLGAGLLTLAALTRRRRS